MPARTNDLHLPLSTVTSSDQPLNGAACLRQHGRDQWYADAHSVLSRGHAGNCKENFFPLSELPKRPYMHRREGRPISLRTVWRWVLKGCRGRRLQTCMRAGTRCTSDEWALGFLGTFDTVPPVDTPVRMRTPTRRQQQIAKAERQLEKLGI
jgi:hypothetical protein